MGRGRACGLEDEAVFEMDTRSDNDGFLVLPPNEPAAIGSEIHRQRLEGYARARTGRSDIHLALSHFCATCRHEYEEHTIYGSSTYCNGTVDEERGCECNNYRPSGGSFTDMKGNITVQSDVPPNGIDEERELAILGLLRHELCHEMYTDPKAHKEFVEDMMRRMQNGEEITAGQRKNFWNILEDGMIETRLRHEIPEAYHFISALNRVYPRVGQETVLEEEMQVPAPEGYVPEDADGNPLANISQEPDPYTGDLRNILTIPAGTRISPWGLKPVSLEDQAQSALLAEAIPEFEPGCGRVETLAKDTLLPLPEGNASPCDIDGNPLEIRDGKVFVPEGTTITHLMRQRAELHPEVQAALDEADEHIDAAVRGNSRDCVLRAHAVHEIFQRRGLLRGDLTEEERRMLEQLQDAMGGLQPSAPEGGGPQDGSGGGSSSGPANGQPGESGGISDQLQDAMNGGGGSGGEKSDQESKDGKGSSGGDSEAGDKSDENSGEGGGGFGQEGAQSGVQSGGDEASGGFDADKPLPQSARENNGQGGATQEDLDRMIEEARSKQNQDKSAQREDDEMRRRQNKLEANEVQSPDGSRAQSQRELAEKAQKRSGAALEKERSELQALGHELASDLQRMKVETRARSRRQRSGRLDKRSLVRVPTGDRRVFSKRSKEDDFDMEIDVVIDRSGSVTCNNVDNTNQMRMALMFGAASNQADIPMSIYGYDGGGGHSTTHYAYKERHSRDLSGLEALPSSGGGGTPTGDAVRRARWRLRTSDSKQRVMFVITDGQPSYGQREETRDQVDSARREGVQVIGLGFGVGSNLSPESMDELFGEGGWQALEDYREAPIILSRIVREAASKAMA